MKRVDALTSLRFFAALGVLLHHGGLVFFPGPASRFTFLGFTGVTFFFALSGFVLTWSYRPGTKRQFYRRRIARVYPLHLVTWIAATVVGVVLAQQSFHLVPWMSGLLLLQAWVPTEQFYFAGNGPAWSLSCEAFFYAVFPFVIVWAAKRGLRTVLTVLGALVAAYALVVVACAASGFGGFTLLYINPAGRFVDFAVGIVIALVAKAGVRCPVPLPVAVGMVLAYLLGVGVLLADRGLGLFADRYVGDALMLPLAAVLLWSAATRTGGTVGRVLSAKTLIRLGEWSFAMYLVQFMLLWPLEARLETHPWTLGQRVLAEAAFVVATVVVAGLAHHAVERPLERRLRGARPRPELQAAA